MRIPTVTIVNPRNPDYWLTINQSDYDPDRHVLWESREVANPASLSRAERQAELESMSWRDIKAIAETWEIDKPESGWDEAIPLILDFEYGD